MGRLAWRRGRSRAPFRPWRAAHRPRVRHRGRGMRHASPGRHGRRPVRQRHGRGRRRRVQDRARPAAQALPRSEGPGIGDVPAGLVAGTRSVRTGPRAAGQRNGPKPSIMQAKRRKPPHYKSGTKNRPYHPVSLLQRFKAISESVGASDGGTAKDKFFAEIDGPLDDRYVGLLTDGSNGAYGYSGVEPSEETKKAACQALAEFIY